MKNGETFKLIGLTFSDCNIQGLFEHKLSMLFDNCRFHSCDFAFSQWYRATFRNCEFKNCSLSLSGFKECEFRSCTWSRIGFSGSKTDIVRTFITNPAELIRAGYSGCNPDRSGDREHVAYQRFRLEGTKAHLARTLLYSHELVGDDKTYYDTARLHDLQQTKSRISESYFNLRFASGFLNRLRGLVVIFWLLEWLLLWLIGIINAWGSRLLQPLLVLLLSAILFGFLYQGMPSGDGIVNPWQKTFDIATLAGYTNQSNASQSVHLRFFENLQLAVSIFLYTIFFSTAVARLSRTR
jgi:hypothetical protein